MSSQPYLPENVTEIGSIHISVGLAKHGTGASFVVDNLSAEQAIGYLVTVTDQLRQQVSDRWAGEDDSFEIGAIHVTCPNCHEDVDIDLTEDDECE